MHHVNLFKKHFIFLFTNKHDGKSVQKAKHFFVSVSLQISRSPVLRWTPAARPGKSARRSPRSSWESWKPSSPTTTTWPGSVATRSPSTWTSQSDRYGDPIPGREGKYDSQICWKVIFSLSSKNANASTGMSEWKEICYQKLKYLSNSNDLISRGIK